MFPSSPKECSCSEELRPLPVECLLCDKVFLEDEDEKSAVISDHMLKSHKLVIGEIQEIADLPKYAALLLSNQ